MLLLTQALPSFKNHLLVCALEKSASYHGACVGVHTTQHDKSIDNTNNILLVNNKLAKPKVRLQDESKKKQTKVRVNYE